MIHHLDSLESKFIKTPSNNDKSENKADTKDNTKNNSSIINNNKRKYYKF